MLSAEWLKIRHSALKRLVFLAPVGYALCMLWYCGCFTNHPRPLSDIHEVFYQAGCIALPLAVALLAGLLCAAEETAGNYGGCLQSPVSRGTIYLSKLISLLVLLVILVGGAVLIMSAALALGHAPLGELKFFLQGGAYALLGAVPIAILQLYISLAFGTGASLGVGGAGLLISAIMGTTTIGNTVWPYVPWTWAARLSDMPVVNYEDVRLPAHIEHSFRMQMTSGAVPLMLTMAVGLLISLVWFGHFSGRKSAD